MKEYVIGQKEFKVKAFARQVSEELESDYLIDYPIDKVIEYLLELKRKGATHIEFNGTGDYEGFVESVDIYGIITQCQNLTDFENCPLYKYGNLKNGCNSCEYYKKCS